LLPSQQNGHAKKKSWMNPMHREDWASYEHPQHMIEVNR